MTTISFCKFHGFGNDYIVIERENIPSEISLEDLAVEICHRHTGAGSDGIAVLEKLDGSDADYFCEIVNPDGSVAGFSGNGTRCAVAYLYYKTLWSEAGLRLKTRSGVKNYTMLENASEGSYVFNAEIGFPKFRTSEVPVAGDTFETVIDREIEAGGRKFLFSGVNVGNPVACIFVDDFDFDWRHYGRIMETHQEFPQRANIVFVRVIDDANIELRIWERGAGETSASGTCSSGAAVLSAFTGKTGRRVSVTSRGGVTEVDWRDEDDEILLTGRAELSYCGEWPTAKS
ncbi:MAG: diaminopimelate epimerase [Acidobacteria bacterium]|nr:MAG: diaminopimelate epimerase [Acidobacteriota bacterium]